MFRQANLWIPLRNGKAGAFPKKGAPIDFVGVIDGFPLRWSVKKIKQKESLWGKAISVKRDQCP